MDYRHSSHATHYEQIARSLNTVAQHVYEIAHGKRLRGYDDFVIQDRLFRAGILR